jgi:hypothetical protein
MLCGNSDDSPRKTLDRSTRITNNPGVEFAVCTQRGKVTGKTFAGTARVLAPAELAAVIGAKKRRYFTFRLIHLFKKDQVAIEITPNA